MAETWKIVTKKVCQFFFRLSWHFKRENSVFWKASFCKTRTDYACKTSWTSAIQRVLRFYSGNLFYKSNRKHFSCVCIAWHKHSRGWENSQQLCKPSTLSRVCITVSNSPNPSRVYIRLCKHGKRFLFRLKHQFIKLDIQSTTSFKSHLNLYAANVMQWEPGSEKGSRSSFNTQREHDYLL